MSWKIVAALSFAVGITFGLTGSASVQAGAVFSADELVFNTGGIELKLRNFEQIGVDLNSNGVLEVGDTLRGIFEITTGSAQLGGPNLTPTGFELTGIFETEILTADLNPLGDALGNSFTDFTYGPNADFATEFGLPTGTMIAFYEDVSPDFPDIFSAPDVATAEGFATNGDLYATFGAAPGSVHGTDYFWTAEGFADLSDFGTVGGLTTAFAASLELLSQPGTGLQFIADQTQTPTSGFAGLGFEDIANELAFQGNVTSNVTGAPYALQSQDPARLRAVPEPTSLLAWAGFAALGGVVYRRRTYRQS